jgi:nucleotidyltransferase substrate binding protein (TIGR01987 family)
VNDIRWIQRLGSFTSALNQLKEAVLLTQTRTVSNLEKQGLIKAFEFTYELAWNTLKDYYEFQGDQLQGSRDTIRLAFKRGLITNGQIWMEMIDNRNRTSHTYDEKTANDVIADILNKFYNEFITIHTILTDLSIKE